MTAFLMFLFSMISGIPNEEDPQVRLTSYYIIRHAEKDTTDPSDKDPLLTQAGLQRAANWAETFKEVEFEHIFSSDFNRTRKTAEIIAKRQDKTVEFYDPVNLDWKALQKKAEGKTVLIVGHSNTNPQLVNALIGEQKYEDIPEEESGSLFLVTASPEGVYSSQVLYIN